MLRGWTCPRVLLDGPYHGAVLGYVKRRGVPPPGSIPEALDMFRAEVRFYQEIAPVVGVRVPLCHRAEAGDDGTLLVLEDLSSWRLGAEPAAAARVLSNMHRRWEGQAHRRWPWLRQVGAAADLVGDLFDRVWHTMVAREDLTRQVRGVGDRLVGHVVDAERAVALAGPVTLAHGDASMQNLRTGPQGEVALLDWEDVSAGPGALDLAWLLLSSVQPGQWDEVIAAYGRADGLNVALPAVLVQGLLTMSDLPDESTDAMAWAERLEEAARRIDRTT
jgi:fructosamine-3-kinase